MNPCVIGFSGRIKSGKTTIATATASSLDWQCASFGDYVRWVAIRQNEDPESRAALQRIGESCIARGWPAFCHNVLKMVNWRSGMPVVVDGIRHVEAVEQITDRFTA